jgi:predicted membrane protein DUF2231
MEHIKMSGMTFSSDAGVWPAATAHGRTIHERLTPFPVAYFTAALVTDFVYWRTPDTMWERFSVWLIAGGLVMAAFVALAAVVDLVAVQASRAGLYLRHRAVRIQRLYAQPRRLYRGRADGPDALGDRGDRSADVVGGRLVSHTSLIALEHANDASSQNDTSASRRCGDRRCRGWTGEL